MPRSNEGEGGREGGRGGMDGKCERKGGEERIDRCMVGGLRYEWEERERRGVRTEENGREGRKRWREER